MPLKPKSCGYNRIVKKRKCIDSIWNYEAVNIRYDVMQTWNSISVVYAIMKMYAYNIFRDYMLVVYDAMRQHMYNIMWDGILIVYDTMKQYTGKYMMLCGSNI